ncbi:hypothetical protein PanWU01x14_121770 [Parasponia andersonii]|uniref:Transmembrane protein n=1 Tax=Parasponia andersonii TaxID=3476 RepID=A0A2P5CUG9_PARAD|nr:hypothetical protein PanWU01x14_121770 [Parasponia andersonii]
MPERSAWPALPPPRLVVAASILDAISFAVCFLGLALPVMAGGLNQGSSRWVLLIGGLGLEGGGKPRGKGRPGVLKTLIESLTEIGYGGINRLICFLRVIGWGWAQFGYMSW